LENADRYSVLADNQIFSCFFTIKITLAYALSFIKNSIFLQKNAYSFIQSLFFRFFPCIFMENLR
ncbi:hypothetical protein, partial [Anaerotignum lactatifermentans]|uniref:hypothetical protein n=1 Tax=Anaerotignum lactatifermentans TaxID=160404 RepID=UPI0024B1020D